MLALIVIMLLLTVIVSLINHIWSLNRCIDSLYVFSHKSYHIERMLYSVIEDLNDPVVTAKLIEAREALEKTNPNNIFKFNKEG